MLDLGQYDAMKTPRLSEDDQNGVFDRFQEKLFRITHPDVILANGRIVAHKPYISGGKPNGATEAYMLDGGNMTNDEWSEYCSLIHSR